MKIVSSFLENRIYFLTGKLIRIPFVNIPIVKKNNFKPYGINGLYLNVLKIKPRHISSINIFE